MQPRGSLGSMLLGAIAGLVLAAVAVGALSWSAFRDGFSARARPTAIEASLAHTMLHASVPAAYASLTNPAAATPATLHEAMEHYADHCAVCHANDGSGDTMLGRGLNPAPPDLRAPRTQARSDGELYAVIENGVRMSGMPAFGHDEGAAPGKDPETWALVRFLRHLPSLSPDEALAMRGMNPVTPDERKEEQEEDEFLNSGSAQPSQTATPSRRSPKDHDR